MPLDFTKLAASQPVATELQRPLPSRRNDVLCVLFRESDLIASGDIEFLPHTLLVLLTADTEEWQRHEADGPQIAIKVKGRARTGEIELRENEWAKACTLGDKYWLYVICDCASVHPRLVRVQNPFSKLLAKAHGGVIINAGEIFQEAKHEQ